MSYKYQVMLINVDGDNRPGIKSSKSTVTIHNTANTATDEQERNNLARTDNKEEVGFHYCIDEDSVTLIIPIDEIAYHCGNKTGNYSSIGMEIAERPGAEDVAIEFLADTLLPAMGWTVANLRTHQSWSGKYCPRQILPHWDKFVQAVKDRMEGSGNMAKGIIVYRAGDIGTAFLLGSKLQLPVMDISNIMDSCNNVDISKLEGYEAVHLIGRGYSIPGVNAITHGVDGVDRYDTAKKSL